MWKNDRQGAVGAPVALVDCDGVLAHFASPVLAHCNEITGRALKFSDVTSFEMEKLYPELTIEQVFEPCSREGFCGGLSAFAGARDGIEELRKVAHVVALTAPWWPSKYWHAERMWWLTEKMGFDPGDIIFCSKKELVRGDLIVDDRWSHVDSWTAANSGRGFLWHRPYNYRSTTSERVTRTGSWTEVSRYASLVLQSKSRSALSNATLPVTRDREEVV